MAPSLDPQMIAEFQNGIYTRDLARVQAALDAGIDPATPIGADHLHPLVWLLTGAYESFAEEAEAAGTTFSADNTPSRDQFIQRGSEIVDLLLSRDIKLVKDVKFTRNPLYLVDSCLDSPYLKDLSSVVIQTISQTLERKGAAYQPDTAGFLGSYVRRVMAQQPDIDRVALVTEALNILDDVHAVVQQRLKNPQTPVEKDIVANHSDALGFWMQAFDRPAPEQVLGQKPAAPVAASVPVAAANGNGMLQVISASTQNLPLKTKEQVLAQINEMVGMEEVKQDIQSLLLRAQFDAARRDNGLKAVPNILNSVFEGGPGTGKTTMARNHAELLHALGLAGDKYVEVNSENMMSLFPGGNGQLAIQKFDSADIIFLDDVFGIVSNPVAGNAGKILIDILTTALEKRRGSDKALTVFFSGSQKQLDGFFAANPVLKSHITHYEHLKDFTMNELGTILDRQVAEAGLKMDPAARECALGKLEAHRSDNTRSIRSLLEQLPDRMAARLFGQTAKEITSKRAIPMKPEALSLVTKADVEAVEIMTGGTQGKFGYTAAPGVAKKAPGLGS